jgi:pimeloyl-ACP methyl ester carboxylesterase
MTDWAGLANQVPVELATTTIGPADGAPVVVLHGLFGSGRNWMTVARHLAGPWRFVTPDLRNHGASPWADTMTYPSMAADVVALIEGAEGGGPCALVGHSMGGKVAMIVALSRPDLVERLVVVDVAPVAYESVFRAYAEAMLAARLDGVTRRNEVDAQLVDVVPKPGTRAFLLQNLVLTPTPHWRANLRVLAESMDDIAGFPAVPAGVTYERPTTFISGEQSDYVTPVVLPVIGRLFPRSRRVVVPDAGHWVHSENFDGFVVRLREALEGRSGA